MLIRRFALENVWSFLDRQELVLDGQMSILIGPNGGGKTNLLDALAVMVRRYVLGSQVEKQIGDGPDRKWVLEKNPQLANMRLDRHFLGAGRDQILELEVEVTFADLDHMRQIRDESLGLRKGKSRNYPGDPTEKATEWAINDIVAGTKFTFRVKNDQIEMANDAGAKHYLEYLQLFELDNEFRRTVGLVPFRQPYIYFSVNRTVNALDGNVNLAGFQETEHKQALDRTFSKQGSDIGGFAMHRLAALYRELLEDDNVKAKTAFDKLPNVKTLISDLKKLGFSWYLESVNPVQNTYRNSVTKQGTSFAIARASSGEKELLTYLFAIHALNIRDAVFLIDEPELHLHPKWQRELVSLFERLGMSTGNQFVMATHAQAFVSPRTAQYVSRVYSDDQCSKIVRLRDASLPNAKLLFNIVNSQNNEKVFFAERVILVEGPTDRIFFERIFRHLCASAPTMTSTEVLEVGGKTMFSAYVKILEACAVKYAIVADRDYIQQIGTDKVKKLFEIDSGKIKRAIDEHSSADASVLVTDIENAMDTGDWANAKSTWEYVKSRRIKLKANLSESEKGVLDGFLSEQRETGVYILKNGVLEDYLPADIRTKDIGKLVEFLDDVRFWSKLPKFAKVELKSIAGDLFG